MRSGLVDMATGALLRVFLPGEAPGDDYGDAEVVAVPDGWPDAYAWDEAARSFVAFDQLAPAKAARWMAVRALRDAKLNGGVTIYGGRYDTDAVARQNVTGATVAAQAAIAAGIPFLVEWILADNSTVELDAATMIAVHLAGISYISALYAHSQVLRGEIMAAADLAALDAIDIEAGWPSDTLS